MKPCPPTWLYNWYYRLIFVPHYGHFRPKKYFQHPRKRSQLISIPTVKNSDLNTENIRCMVIQSHLTCQANRAITQLQNSVQ